MSRRPPRPVEIACPTCGLIVEVRAPGRAAAKLCDCPTEPRVAPVTRPRLCVSCGAVLSRYNAGVQCRPCATAGRAWDPDPAG